MSSKTRPPNEQPAADDSVAMDKAETSPQLSRQYVGIVCAAIVLTVVAGVVQGRLAGRWNDSSVLEEAGVLLQQFPEEFGSWRTSKSTELSEKVEGTLMCRGYINRTYVNRQTGETVSVAVLVGPPGPMSVHTPEICFSSKQFDVHDDRREISVRDEAEPEESFWSVGFRTRDVHAHSLQVYYAWNNGSGWRAADNPRFGFATAPYLYKIQVAVSVAGAEINQKAMPGTSFLQEFLPALQPYLVNEGAGVAEDKGASPNDD